MPLCKGMLDSSLSDEGEGCNQRCLYSRGCCCWWWRLGGVAAAEVEVVGSLNPGGPVEGACLLQAGVLLVAR